MHLTNKAILVLLDEIETVQVHFETTYIEGMSTLYTYIAKKGTCTAGQLVVVQSPDGQYSFVKVHSVDSSASNFNVFAPYEYKWIVDVVDLDTYMQQQKTVTELAQIIQQTERKKVLSNVREELFEALPDNVKSISLLTDSGEK